MAELLLLPFPKLMREFKKDERQCIGSQQKSINNCNRMLKDSPMSKKCKKDMDKFSVMHCMKAVGAKYFRKIGPMNDFVYPWNNFDWDYASYVDKNYNADITGANIEPTMKGLYDNIGALGKIGSGYIFDPNPGVGRKPGGPIIAYSGIPDDSACDGVDIKKDWFGRVTKSPKLCRKKVKQQKAKGFRTPIAGRDDKENCRGNATCKKIQNMQMAYRNKRPPTDSPVFTNKSRFPLEGKGASSYFVNMGYCKKDKCVTDRMCLGVIFSNTDSLKDSKNIDLIPAQLRVKFKKALDDKKLTYKAFKTDNCNKIEPDLQFTYKTEFCLDGGKTLVSNVLPGGPRLKEYRKWLKSIDKKGYPNGGICYEKRYVYINNESGGKIKLSLPDITFTFKDGFTFKWGKAKIIELPKGLIPSMMMDFMSLNPINLMSIMLDSQGVGMDSLKCDNGKKSMCGIEGFVGNNSEIERRYSLVMNNKVLYILFWTVIILIFSYLIKYVKK